jgi:hypothetical protein
LNVIWAILCERAVIDRDTNNASLFNVIEEMQIPAQPPLDLSQMNIPTGIFPAMFELMVLWVRSNLEIPERGRGRVLLIVPGATDATGPGGTDALQQGFEVDLTQFLRVRTRLRFPGLPAGDTGIYRFVVQGKAGDSEWATMFELPIRVLIQAQESG